MRVCAYSRCPKEIPEERKSHAKYCDDRCKRAAHRERTGTVSASRLANRFWDGYGHVRRRPVMGRRGGPSTTAPRRGS